MFSLEMPLLSSIGVASAVPHVCQNTQTLSSSRGILAASGQSRRPSCGNEAAHGVRSDCLSDRVVDVL